MPHVQERPARAERAVHGQELRPVGGHEGVQRVADQIRVLGGGGVEIGEQHALGRERGIQVRQHHVGVVLDEKTSPLSHRAGRCEDVGRHVVQVLCPSSRCVRREVQREVRQIRVAPLLRLLRRDGERRELLERLLAQRRGEPGRFRQCGERMLVEGGGQRLGHVDLGGRQPTEPSIWSSIRRLSSTAYSMGSSRVMGSMNPFTIMAVASTSDRPRLIR